MGTGEAGDGGGSQAEDTEDIGKLVEVGIGKAGFDQATGKDADEGDLFDKTGGIGGFDTGEVTFFEATGVEAVLEGIVIAVRGARAAVGGGHSG